ncbi:hypothetical protein [Wenzhouxiangella sp. EGI_FJ10409]|uniref:hypothetical protein n=1 Tax=Wenzhouxiangella sp. EGI_FJ10409 TaxID=3243767 RepID=UPI0035D99D5B
MKLFEKLAISATLPLLLSACGSNPTVDMHKVSVDPRYRMEELTDPIGTSLSVNVGETLFAKGEFAFQEAYKLERPIRSKMPGSMGIPFNFSIERSVLTKSYRRANFEYFCAPFDKVNAWFGGLGKVIQRGDCVGVRRHTSSGALQWVVDNSVHNGMTTVWNRDYERSEDPILEKAEGDVTAAGSNMTQIRFDGYYSSLLHFTLVERSGSSAKETEFKFDYPPQNSEAVYGIKGNTFEVVDVNNVQLTYEWRSFSAE